MLRDRVVPVVLALLSFALAMPAFGQQGPQGPPAVGVVRVVKQPITETSEFVGRIQAEARVALVARVTAFLSDVNFKDGTEVKKGQVLYRLDRAPFQADVDAKQAVIDQLKAQLTNANITLERAQTLMRGPAGQQSNVDTALANQRALVAQVRGRPGQSADVARSISAIPRSTRRSTARSAAPTSRPAMSWARRAARSPPSCRRTRCT